MGASDRTVQHLRLRAPSAQVAVHAAHRLEDALRCASLPDAGERVLLVRRLHLGRLPTDLSPQSLSLLIEQRVQAAGGHWVQGGQDHAAESCTVFFASRLQAAQAAVRRRAEGRSLNAWYWRLALPGMPVEASDEVFLRHVVDALASESAAAVSLPALVADIVAAGHAAWLVRHASPATRSSLLAIGGVGRQVQVVEREWAATAVRGPLGRVTDPALSTSMGCRYQATGGTGIGRAVDLQAPLWLHAVLRAAHWAPVSAAVAIDPVASLSSTAANWPTSPWHEAGQMPPSTAETPPIASTPVTPVPVGAEGMRDPLPPDQQDRREQRQAAAEESAGPPTALAPQIPTSWDDLAPTGAGGLLFLIPVLERLGFGEWQQQQADRPLTGLLLCQVLQRLRVPEQDAAWALVASLPMAHGPDIDVHAHETARRWRLACSRYLRDVARIGLARLCLRRAQVGWSATHLDVRFSLAAADLRVRRAGLDVDPGWVDWLQRVVRFEYTHEGPG